MAGERIASLNAKMLADIETAIEPRFPDHVVAAWQFPTRPIASRCCAKP